MYRTSSHEPRYNRSARKGRHDESRDGSENSTSDDEEESTDSGTEESCETRESQGSESVQRDSLYSAESSYHHKKPFNKIQNAADSFVTSHFCHSKVIKHDKITQKNLLSPFPSFTVPPVYRELSACRGHSGRSDREKHIEATNTARPPKHSPRRQESDDENEDSICYIHKTCLRKAYDRHRGPREHGSPHQSRSHRPERILTCVNASTTIEPSEKGTPEMPSPKMPPPAPPVPARRPKTAGLETVTSNKCQETRGRSVQRQTLDPFPFIVDQTLPGEAAPAKGKGSKKMGDEDSGEVKEKLVYVVEEKGKNPSKVETDLFTLNEILAIKKDLVELSEFAKKLKKLKGMKKEPETKANLQAPCQCKPPAELLKDVNRRIEALEARQEELERGSKSEKKGGTETDSKKTTNGEKTSSDSQSKMPVAVKTSAMTSIPSFPKMETFGTRTDNFSNNSDIVNELMDIKTQLHKLEQKRLSKAVLETAPAAEDMKPPKKEEAAIAVFSSKTYILTDNFNKRKGDMKIDEDKVNNYCSTVEEEEDDKRKEQTKEQIANWLRGVSPKNQDMAYLPPSSPKREDSSMGGTERKNDLKCKNCLQVMRVDDFPNQEPQKNRATEKDGTAESDLGFADTRKNDSPGKRPSQMIKYKECIVTASGKVFACVNCSSGKVSPKCPEECRPKSAQPPSFQPRSEEQEASCSIPSAVLVKERVRKMKADLRRKRRYPLLPRVINSKPAPEVCANASKNEKTARNTNLKNIDKMAQQREKKYKDGKNQCLKLLEANLMALRKTLKRDTTTTTTTTSSATHSEFLASVNLDVGTASAASTFECGDTKAMVMAYSTTIQQEGDVYIDDCFEERRRSAREQEKRLKRREAECKKMLKKKLKVQKMCEAAERKRKRQQHKYEMKQLKQRCKELKYGKECVTKKSRSLDNYPPIKRSVEISSPKKSRSSQEFYPKKCQPAEEATTSKKYCSSEESISRKRRSLEPQKKCYCEPAPAPKPCRYEEEPVPRNRRYREEEFDEKCKEDTAKRCYEREDVPRKYYDREEVSRRPCEKEDIPRKYRYEENECAPRYKEPSICKRTYSKEDTPRRQRFDECYTPPKKVVCEPIDGKSNREKLPKEEDFQKSSEDVSGMSQCLKSEDSWLLYKNQQEEQLRKMKYRMSKQPSDACKLRNLMKNIGMLKLNFPFGGEFCDGKHENCKKSKSYQKHRRGRGLGVSEDDKLQWDFSMSNCEDEGYYDYHDNRNYHEHHSRNPQTHQQLHYSHHHHHHPDRLAFPDSCRCVRVFLQSPEQKGWSGLGPFRKVSSDSATEMSSSKTAESSKSYKNNFGLPKVKTPVFQVGYSCQDSCTDKCHRDKCCDKCPDKDDDKCRRKDEKCRSKCCKKREKCERKKEKKKHKKCKKCKCKKKDGCCKCKKCGNIHRRGCSPPAPPPCPPCKKEPIIPCAPKEPVKSEESVPFVSFLSNICKPRQRDPKSGNSSRNFLKKLDEVRYLKMCPSVARKRSKRSKHSSSAAERCNCTSKLTDIESRLSVLENAQQDECMEKCCKKKHKKKKHKCDKCCCKSETDCCRNESNSCRKQECNECERKERNDCRKPECNECERKERNDCRKPECNECDRKERNDCQKKERNECQKKECNECERKERNECQKKECNECGKKECGECPPNKCCECKKKKKKKKKCDCCPNSESDECQCKKKKRKKHKCDCCECERGDQPPCGQEVKPCERRPKPCETPTYYQTFYCPSAGDMKNNSSLSDTSKSSTTDEKESSESSKSKEEPPQKEPPTKEELSSLHSFWKNLRRYSINHGRNGMENLMRRIRGKKSSCILEPDVSLVDDLRKVSSDRENNEDKQRERKNPEKPASKSRRKRHE